MNNDKNLPHILHIPGDKLKDFDYHLVANRMYDQNREFTGTITTRPQVPIEGRAGHTIERTFGKLYDDIMSLPIDEHTPKLFRPIVIPIYNSDDNLIYTNIHIQENFKSQLKKEDFEIFQQYTIGLDGNPQLSYYICFKFSDADRKRGLEHRYHKFSVKSIPIQNNFEAKYIKNVMACFVNINPQTSRGTVTTVKNASGE